jgi:hypothetical protein
MKKNIVRLVLAVILLINIAGFALAQKPKVDKDTINADKAAKPVFYQAAEEETSKGGNTGLYIACGVAVGAGVVFLLRKKKK